MKEDRDRPTGPIPGRPGEYVEGVPPPAIVLAAIPLGVVLGLGARIVCNWMGWV